MRLTDLFFVVVYLSVIGGLFGVASLFVSHIFGRVRGLWLPLCGMALYLLPVLSPEVWLFSPEPEQRMDGFVLAGRVWAAGCLLFLAYRLTRLFLAGRTIRRYPPCADRRIIDIAAQCAYAQKMKRPPRLLETALDAPASVAGVMRPVILVNTDGLSGLTDRQLRIVLTHELTHIKRGHLLFQRIFDFVCVLHWFNPLVWWAADLSRRDGEVSTFDLRFKKPNTGDLLTNAQLHSVEHIIATLLRNSPERDAVIYFGPMGCQTGFYFLFDSRRLTDAEAIALLQRVFTAGAAYDGPMPGKSAAECGNYRNLDAALARACCAFYADVIRRWTPEDLVYPEA